jgi:aryl-alcohol dehydrogenase-like predicted oxidoreductase
MSTETAQIPSLASYSLLGRSGLRVSPLCLGGMTFGTDWGWGCPQETVYAILDRYFEAGGNFVDTADLYVGGKSEEMIGAYVRERGLLDRAVIATKFTFNAEPGNPNAGGNGRKNMQRAVEGSLRRLGVESIDLLWVHAWDGLTPAEELLRGLDDLVRAGKVRYLGLSDAPAWYFARSQTLAELRGWTAFAGLQLEYSLVERTVEREHVPAALELGAGIMPWSPLASGLLTGKYKRAANGLEGDGRLQAIKDAGNPSFDKVFNQRNWQVVDVLLEVAEALGRTPAQVALNWVATRPGVTSTLVGATKLHQLEENLRALELEIPAEHADRLEEVSKLPPANPYLFFEETMRGMIDGGAKVRREPAWFRPRAR